MLASEGQEVQQQELNNMNKLQEENQQNGAAEEVVVDGAGGITDEEVGLVPHSHGSFVVQCQLALQLGLAAYQYGSFADTVERFVEKLIHDIFTATMTASASQNINVNNEQRGIFDIPLESITCRISNTEVFLCVLPALGDLNANNSSYHSSLLPITIMTECQEGYHLDKLSRVAGLAAEVLLHAHSKQREGVSLKDAVQTKLVEIGQAPHPYGVFAMALCWMMVGFGLPPVLGGTWWDALVGSGLSGVTYSISIAFSTYVPASYQIPWSNFIMAFVAGCLSAALKFAIPSANINVLMTTLSAVAIPLPGYGISFGVAELVKGRMITGMAHLVGGLVTLGWLVLGAILGVLFISGVTLDDDDGEPELVKPPPEYWQALFIPLLCIGLAIAFQTSYCDFWWSIFSQGMAYTVVVAFSYLPTDDSYAGDVGVIVSSLVMTVGANAWSRWKDKPTNILLVPCLVLQVSGSIGFRGIVALAQGQTAVGTEQFLRMVYVALLIFIGVAIGMVALKPGSTV